MGKRKSSMKDATPQERRVAFKELKNQVELKKTLGTTTQKKNGGMHPSPSMNTLNRLEREKIVFQKVPFKTLYYAFLESCHLVVEFFQWFARQKLVLFLLAATMALLYYLHLTPGSHQPYMQFAEMKMTWWTWWVFLGVLSSIGFGFGLHTFLIYLGPHIARVTLAAYECGTLNFPEPPYPDSIVCPDNGQGGSDITIFSIMKKVQVEALLWGAGTALGELPPYFMARAARLSGEEPDDEEYKEFKALQEAESTELSLWERFKKWCELKVAQVGFFGILLFASIPNPLFDLAGITCGHFLVPFWSFFGATLIGKAVVKMHLQMILVIFALSQHHVDTVLRLVENLPFFGYLFIEQVERFLENQRQSLHKGHKVSESGGLIQWVIQMGIGFLFLLFCLQLLNTLAQNYHKRTHARV